MPEMFEARSDDVAELDPKALVVLMECLIENELVSNRIALTAAYVSLDINIRDGGEDGLVSWNRGAPETDFFPKRRCLFQSKAGTLQPKDFIDELFTDSKRTKLKSRVKLNVDEDGAYVLFYAGPCVGLDADKHIEEMKVALEPFYPGKSLTIEIYDRSTIAKWTRQHFSRDSYGLALGEKKRS